MRFFSFTINILWIFLLLFFDPVSGHGFPCRGFEITLNGQTTVIRTPPDEWSVGHIPLPDNTHHSQETGIHAPCPIRTRSSSKRRSADPRSRPRGHWYLPLCVSGLLICFFSCAIRLIQHKNNYIFFRHSLWFPKLRLIYQLLAKLNWKTSDRFRIM
jgi:hypothetical protein